MFRENTARTGLESGTLTLTFAAGGSRKTARMYAVANDSGGAVESVVTSTGGLDPVSFPSVVAGGVNRLAMAFVAADDDNAIGSATGETGGDWTEATAEYLGSGLNSMLQLQTAAMASGGTISGGTASMGADDDWVVTAFAVVGT